MQRQGEKQCETNERFQAEILAQPLSCLLYTSDAADERSSVDLGGRRIIKKKNTWEPSVTRSSTTRDRYIYRTNVKDYVPRPAAVVGGDGRSNGSTDGS